VIFTPDKGTKKFKVLLLENLGSTTNPVEHNQATIVFEILFIDIETI